MNLDFLDLCYESMSRQISTNHDEFIDTFKVMVQKLHEVKCNVDETVWYQKVCKEIQDHPIANMMQHDPFTRRSFVKPRGYAGDAVLLDYVYDVKAPADTNEIGRRLFKHILCDYPSTSDVRYRRKYVASRISELVANSETPLTIFSVACGHLREYELLDDDTRRNIQAIIALDQDPKSIEYIMDCYPSEQIEVVVNSIKSLLKNEYTPPTQFDIIYASGLYDYLTDKYAKSLTTTLFSYLKKGGTLLIPNFLPHIVDSAYIDSIMDWVLIGRTEAQMRGLTTGLPKAEIAKTNIFSGPYDTIIYLEITKA